VIDGAQHSCSLFDDWSSRSLVVQSVGPRSEATTVLTIAMGFSMLAQSSTKVIGLRQRHSLNLVRNNRSAVVVLSYHPLLDCLGLNEIMYW
jgi:hypothetical protein